MDKNLVILDMLEQSGMNEFELRCLCASLLTSMQEHNGLTEEQMDAFITDMAQKFAQTYQELENLQ